MSYCRWLESYKARYANAERRGAETKRDAAESAAPATTTEDADEDEIEERKAA